MRSFSSLDKDARPIPRLHVAGRHPLLYRLDRMVPSLDQVPRSCHQTAHFGLQRGRLPSHPSLFGWHSRQADIDVSRSGRNRRNPARDRPARREDPRLHRKSRDAGGGGRRYRRNVRFASAAGHHQWRHAGRGPRQRIVDDFQAQPPGFDLIVLSPNAAGIGLTITAHVPRHPPQPLVEPGSGGPMQRSGLSHRTGQACDDPPADGDLPGPSRCLVRPDAGWPSCQQARPVPGDARAAGQRIRHGDPLRDDCWRYCIALPDLNGLRLLPTLRD
jgi:hypothetical protein